MPTPGPGELLERPAGAIAAARHAGIPVIFVRVAFREGYPELSSRNRFFGTVHERGGFSEADEDTAIVPALGPEPGDITVPGTTASSCWRTAAWTPTPRCTGS